jgi:hypothetical protein
MPMRALSLHLMTIATSVVLSGCQGIDDSPPQAQTPSQRGRTVESEAASPQPSVLTPAATAGGGTLPTAVRVFSVDPSEIVLRDSDVPPGFRLTTEHPVVAIEFSYTPPLPASSPVRSQPGSGRHAVLVRDDALASDGVISLSTTVVRYETTVSAVAALAQIALPHAVQVQTLTADQEALGDDVRAWHHGRGGVLVDEVAVRTRNYLLGVTVVARSRARGTMPAFAYAQLLRSRLPD